LRVCCAGRTWSAGSGAAAARRSWRTARCHAALQTREIVDTLIADTASTRRGLDTPPELAARIADSVTRLVTAGAASSTTRAADLSATWRLLWTTEKETLFIIQNAGLFGTQAGEVYQVIDVDGGRLQNVVTFPPGAIRITPATLPLNPLPPVCSDMTPQ
jgi:PAP_fibrillin